MPRVTTSRADVVWNYVGTAVSMASGFLLLPLLLAFLTPDELGLWYVYVAIANLAMLFEFGFNPTFARNIVYVISGARRLTKEGCDESSVAEGVDYHLLKTVLKATRAVYAGIAVAALALVGTAGSAYIAFISAGYEGGGRWVSWAVFCAAIFLNLFYLNYITQLRGYGDVAGENRAKTLARLAQLALSAVLLPLGFGLTGAAVGYLANGVLLRAFARRYVARHSLLRAGMEADSAPVTGAEVRGVLATVSHIAWRDGVVQLALYASSQASTILCSLFLTLAQTGTYSILLQLASAVCSFAGAYSRSQLPSFQSAFAGGDTARQRRVVAGCTAVYWAFALVGALGVLAVVFPLLPLFRPGFVSDVPLFLALCAYLALLNHHSMHCCFIISMNEIPYMTGYLVAAVLGIGLAALAMGPLGWGVWGLVAGQAASQLVYNNWRWPLWVSRRLGTGYWALLGQGAVQWFEKLHRRDADREQ